MEGRLTAGRLRVLQVGAFPYPSPQGSQLLLAGTSLGLHRAGHDVRIVCYGHGDPRIEHGGGGDVYARCESAGIPVDRAPRLPVYSRLRSGPDLVKPVLDVLLTATIARSLRQRPVDVVHAHNHEALLASAVAVRSLGFRSAPARSAVLVYGEHTWMVEELPTYFGDRCSGPGVEMPAAAGRWLDRALPGLADAGVALSPRGYAALDRRITGPVALIPPGVHAEDFVGVQPRDLGPGRWLVYAGTLDRFQDLRLLPAVLARLPGWRLLVVTHSEGPNIPGATCVGGTWTEVRDWIAGADVAIVPRASCAGFPMKLLNYAALGLPAVVSDARGLPGEVQVAAGDADAFARGVEQAFEAPRPDRREVFDGWGWRARAADLAQLYASAQLHRQQHEPPPADRRRRR